VVVDVWDTKETVGQFVIETTPVCVKDTEGETDGDFDIEAETEGREAVKSPVLDEEILGEEDEEGEDETIFVCVFEIVIVVEKLPTLLEVWLNDVEPDKDGLDALAKEVELLVRTGLTEVE
jgi:hypothetical protein